MNNTNMHCSPRTGTCFESNILSLIKYTSMHCSMCMCFESYILSHMNDTSMHCKTCMCFESYILWTVVYEVCLCALFKRSPARLNHICFSTAYVLIYDLYRTQIISAPPGTSTLTIGFYILKKALGHRKTCFMCLLLVLIYSCCCFPRVTFHDVVEDRLSQTVAIVQ